MQLLKKKLYDWQYQKGLLESTVRVLLKLTKKLAENSTYTEIIKSDDCFGRGCYLWCGVANSTK